MGILLIILRIIAGIVAVVLIAALFTKKTYSVQKSVTISKPRDQVFNYVSYINNQERYSKWVMADPNVKLYHRGRDGTVGYTSAWESKIKQVGKGEQQIKASVEGKRIDLALHFIKPSEGRAEAFMETETLPGNQTMLTWGLNGRMNYPVNFIMLALIKIPDMLGKDMAISLSNLKVLLEKE